MSIDYEHLITAFETYLLTEKRIARNTFLAYQRDIKQLYAFLTEQNVTLPHCSKADLTSFLKKLKQEGLAATTLARKISAIKVLFAFLEERYTIPNNATTLIFPKLKKTLPVYLTPQELEHIFTIAQKDTTLKGIRNKVMLSLLYASGMRISELLEVRIPHINFQTGFIDIMGKGNKQRSIPLPHPVLQLLQHYLQDTHKKLMQNPDLNKEKYLFFSQSREKITPFTRQAFWVLLRKLILKANISKNISPHTFRHSLATHLLKNGANIRSLQLLLGHESVATVQIYTHLEKSQLRVIYDKKHPRA